MKSALSRVSALPVALAAGLTLVATAVTTSGLAAQQFGGVAAVANDQVLIGEPGNQTLPGIVYVYSRTASGWSEAERLTVSAIDEAPDGFGRSLDADGGLAIIGAPGWAGGRGAAMVYRRDQGGEWREIARLSPDGLGEDAGFGAAVAVDGGVALVSAPGENDGAGAVHVFVEDGGEWVGRADFSPSAGAAEGFGTSVALHGGAALVTTAPSRDVPIGVYGFLVDPSSGMVRSQGMIEPGEDLGERNRFGAALAVRGSLGLVGAPGASGGAGAVVTFELDAEPDAWVPGGILRPFYSAGPEQFGSSVGFDGDQLWVGAPGANSRKGAIYRFAGGGQSGWGRVTRSARDDLADNASFGSSVAIAGDVAVVGAGGIDSRAGGAVILERGDGGGWSGDDLVIGDHRGLPAIRGLDDEIPCVENAAAGYECDNVNIISFLPIKELAGGRGARLNRRLGLDRSRDGTRDRYCRTHGRDCLRRPYRPLQPGDAWRSAQDAWVRGAVCGAT